jgi:hypothetical protein
LRILILVVPQAVRDGYGEFLIGKGITHQDQYTCQKWLRFYLDFCSKYQHDATSSGSLDAFLIKLTEKKQPHQQKNLAQKAVRFYQSFMAQSSPEQGSESQTGLRIAGTQKGIPPTITEKIPDSSSNVNVGEGIKPLICQTFTLLHLAVHGPRSTRGLNVPYVSGTTAKKGCACFYLIFQSAHSGLDE